jgi:epoxyqueuosine reductase
MNLAAQLDRLAAEAGLAAAGIAAVPQPGSPEDQAERARFDAWIADGRAGEMDYLQRRDDAGSLLRSSVRIALPWARSVIVCAAGYQADQPRSTDPAPPDAGWIARYAWTSRPGPDGEPRPSDYHKVLLRRLEFLRDRLAQELSRKSGSPLLSKGSPAAAPFESRCFVDTGPVVERVYARYAGIGWTGKNTCILNQKLGSWIFLGVIVTSLEVPAPAAQLAADRCGSCTRCIDACPTQALVAPRQMDATRCISYLTIEKRGPIPEELRPLIGRQVFGCDICQDVCPWNRRAPMAADPELAPRPALVNPALAWLAALDEPAWERTFNGSPVRRAKFSGFRRNLAIAMGNSGQSRFLPILEEWARDADPALAESARWAAQRLPQTAPLPSPDRTPAPPDVAEDRRRTCPNCR